jgi:hypothetical protein
MSFFQEYLDDLVMEKIAAAGERHDSRTGYSSGGGLTSNMQPAPVYGEMELQRDAITRAQNAKARMREIKRAAKKGEKIHPGILDRIKAAPGEAHKYLKSKGKYVPHAVYGGAGLAALGGGAYLYNRNKDRR